MLCYLFLLPFSSHLILGFSVSRLSHFSHTLCLTFFKHTRYTPAPGPTIFFSFCLESSFPSILVFYCCVTNHCVFSSLLSQFLWVRSLGMHGLSWVLCSRLQWRCWMELGSLLRPRVFFQTHVSSGRIHFLEAVELLAVCFFKAKKGESVALSFASFKAACGLACMEAFLRSHSFW